MKNSGDEATIVTGGTVEVEVENPAVALRDHDGTFKVTSPYGHVFRVTCRKGRNMRVREIGARLSEAAHHDRFEGSGYEPIARRWRIEKIA